MQIFDAGLLFAGDAPSGGKQKNIDAIVLHHRAGNGTVESIHAQHLSQGWWGIGYHYYVMKNGLVWRGRPEEYVGSHAGAKNGYNTHSIGICFEGNFETETMSKSQLNAGRELIADIKKRYAIKEILQHSDIAATACAGKNFPYVAMLATEPKTPETKPPGKAVKVAVGTGTVSGLLIDNVTYVPLREYTDTLKRQLAVTWSMDKGAAVELT